MTRVHPRLPIHRLNGPDGRVIVYTPGHLLVVSEAEFERIRLAFNEDGQIPAGPETGVANEVQAAGEGAVRAWERARWTPFSPECLTVYLSAQCPLACSYCYGRAGLGAEATSLRDTLDVEVIDAAARLVARSCADRARPFHLVIHGGGDPMIHPALVKDIVGRTRRIASAHGVGWTGYVATNGIFSVENAEWLARHVDRVGLSCDGPPEVQDVQRPRADRGRSSDLVEATARVLRNAGARFAIRATITKRTVDRQAELVRYFHECLGASDLRFEPVYGWNGGLHPAFAPADADEFVEYFLLAQREARSRDCTLTLSGVRLDEIHGPNCNVLKQVVQVAPPGVAGPCFLHSTGTAAGRAQRAIGSMNDEGSEFVLDRALIETLRSKATAIPPACAGCINAYHCTRGCPEVCDLDRVEEAAADSGTSEAGPSGGFRCLVYKGLARAWIVEAAGRVPRPGVPVRSYS